MAGGRRPRLGSRGCTRRLRRPRPDSAGGEGETDPAELAIRFDLTGVQWSDGGEVGTHGGTEQLGEERNVAPIRNFRYERGEKSEGSR